MTSPIIAWQRKRVGQSARTHTRAHSHAGSHARTRERAGTQSLTHAFFPSQANPFLDTGRRGRTAPHTSTATLLLRTSGHDKRYVASRRPRNEFFTAAVPRRGHRESTKTGTNRRAKMQHTRNRHTAPSRGHGMSTKVVPAFARQTVSADSAQTPFAAYFLVPFWFRKQGPGNNHKPTQLTLPDPTRRTTQNPCMMYNLENKTMHTVLGLSQTHDRRSSITLFSASRVTDSHRSRLAPTIIHGQLTAEGARSLTGRVAPVHTLNASAAQGKAT